jgi:hypothetical protein
MLLFIYIFIKEVYAGYECFKTGKVTLAERICVPDAFVIYMGYETKIVTHARRFKIFLPFLWYCVLYVIIYIYIYIGGMCGICMY